MSDFHNSLLAKLDHTKPVKFHFPVVDCEHEGDISNDEREVRKYIEPLGGKVTGTYWDGCDCGEAWIEGEIPFDKFKESLLDGYFDYDDWRWEY